MALTSSIELQKRDMEVLEGMFESRIMTLAHVSSIYFEDKADYAKKRLQRLKASGLIRERVRNRNERSILSLTKKALDLLRSNGTLAHYPLSLLRKKTFETRANVSESTIRHDLEVMSVKAAFFQAARRLQNITIETFFTWPLLCQFEVDSGDGVPVKPDGFFQIVDEKTGFGYDCFLELDRSSETQDRLLSKALAYLRYYKSGGFAVRNGGKPSELKDFPFRVLVILNTPERRNNFAARLCQNIPPILTQVWLSTLKEVIENPLGQIWIVPQHYRSALSGTRFLPPRAQVKFAYSRNIERDRFVEDSVKKASLLD